MRGRNRSFSSRYFSAQTRTTSLAAIAAEAGVAEPTVYAVFGSKKGFLLVLRQQMHAEVELPKLTAEAKAAPDARRKLEG